MAVEINDHEEAIIDAVRETVMEMLRDQEVEIIRRIRARGGEFQKLLNDQRPGPEGREDQKHHHDLHDQRGAHEKRDQRKINLLPCGGELFHESARKLLAISGLLRALAGNSGRDQQNADQLPMSIARSPGKRRGRMSGPRQASVTRALNKT